MRKMCSGVKNPSHLEGAVWCHWYYLKMFFRKKCKSFLLCMLYVMYENTHTKKDQWKIFIIHHNQ